MNTIYGWNLYLLDPQNIPLYYTCIQKKTKTLPVYILDNLPLITYMDIKNKNKIKKFFKDPRRNCGIKQFEGKYKLIDEQRD